MNPVRHADLVIRPIALDRVGFWATARAPRDVLLYSPELRQSDSVLGRLKQHRFKRQVPSSNLELLAVLARTGLGVAVLPERVARTHGAGRLRPLAGWPEHRDEVCLVYRHDLPKTAGGGELIRRLGMPLPSTPIMRGVQF